MSKRTQEPSENAPQWPKLENYEQRIKAGPIYNPEYKYP